MRAEYAAVVLETDGRFKPHPRRVALSWCEPHANRAHSEWQVLRELHPDDCANLDMPRLRAELRLRPEVDVFGLHSREDLASRLADALRAGATEPVVTLASHHLTMEFADENLLPGKQYTYFLQVWDEHCGWVEAGEHLAVRTLMPPAELLEAPMLDWFTYQNVYAEFVRNFKSDPWYVEMYGRGGRKAAAPPLNIGLLGRRGCGKSALANTLWSGIVDGDMLLGPAHERESSGTGGRYAGPRDDRAEEDAKLCAVEEDCNGGHGGTSTMPATDQLDCFELHTHPELEDTHVQSGVRVRLFDPWGMENRHWKRLPVGSAAGPVGAAAARRAAAAQAAEEAADAAAPLDGADEDEDASGSGGSGSGSDDGLNAINEDGEEKEGGDNNDSGDNDGQPGSEGDEVNEDDVYADAAHDDPEAYPLRNLSLVEQYLRGHITRGDCGRKHRHKPRPAEVAAAAAARGGGGGTAEVAADDEDDPSAAHADPWLVDTDEGFRTGASALMLAEDDPRLLPNPG